ncbi:MAG: hypothetical protein FJ318_06280 [SAR202 cluster bacterium]|nr:hypothetical protein [SAR202 cluster bacterium]
MKDGYHVIDVDTHVNPTYEVLMRYADRALRARSGELQQYRRVTANPGGADTSILSIRPVRYSRVAGRKAGEDAHGGRDGGQHSLDGRTHQRNAVPYSPGVSDDNATGRLHDMDTEGVGIAFIIPGTWAYGASSLDIGLTRLLYAAYHRYAEDYCSADDKRLKNLLLAPGGDPRWAADAIREHGAKPWAAAVWPVLPEGMSIDDPDMAPVWEAASDMDLPIAYHGFHVMPPYFPGYRDIWDNAVVGRAAGQTWGAQRFLSFMLISGILDQYPSLRVGLLESGHGWLPQWLYRLGHQVDYVRGMTPPELRHMPVEFVERGQVFCGIDFSEGVGMTKAVIDLLGEDVLLYQSDYPHPESIYPDTASTVIRWADRLGAGPTRKMMASNALRMFRFKSVPVGFESLSLS